MWLAFVTDGSFVNSLLHLCLYNKFMTCCSFTFCSFLMLINHKCDPLLFIYGTIWTVTSCFHHVRITEPECPLDSPSDICHGSALCTCPPGQGRSLHRSGWLSSRHRRMARCEHFKSQNVWFFVTFVKSGNWCWHFLRFQYVLVSAGDVVIASCPAPLCDGESHEIQVTVSGNQTLLLVDGQSGRREGADVPTDLLSQSSTFIGGLPGEDTWFCTHFTEWCLQSATACYEICTVCCWICSRIKLWVNKYDNTNSIILKYLIVSCWELTGGRTNMNH